ncbi:hypothetical protein AAY473_022336 [Plecturocebus cupreus]
MKGMDFSSFLLPSSVVSGEAQNRKRERVFTLSLGLKSSGTISAHCNLCLLGLSKPPTAASQHCGRPRWVDHLRSGVQYQPGQYAETLSPLKMQKLAGPGDSQAEQHHEFPARLFQPAPRISAQKLTQIWVALSTGA